MTKKENERVLYESDGYIATITINRPEKRNSINQQTSLALLAAYERYAASDERCAIITGQGDLAFSAGLDFHDPPHASWHNYPGYRVAIDKPMIAAVSGHCIGAGVVIAAHCDLIVASESSTFSFPEGRLGRMGGAAAGFLSRAPSRLAAEMVMLGESLSASRAYDAGLVNRVVPVGQQLPQAREWAQRIAEMAPLVMRGCKAFLNELHGQNSYERALPFMRLLQDIEDSEDGREGPQAWREGRQAQFKGR